MTANVHMKLGFLCLICLVSIIVIASLKIQFR